MRTKEQLAEYAHAYHAKHKSKLNADRTRRSSENKAGQKAYLLKKRFGISGGEYDAMLSGQDGKCLICLRDKSSFSRALAVDHSHRTGKIRGLLCIQCNGGLGNFQDDLTRLDRAIQYLREKEYELTRLNSLVSR